ncbi:glycosyltransferase [Pseudoxanthomonas beigongshangi]
MRFAVATYGTEGDTRPLAALCIALRAAGHETHLLADANTLGSARDAGIPVTPLSGDIRRALAPGQALATAVDRKGGFGQTARALADIANANVMNWMQEIRDVAADGDALILSGLAAFAGLSVAEALDIPVVGTGLIPITPTQAFASPFLSPNVVPRPLHRFSHHAVNGLLWRAFRATTNLARESVLSLPPRKRLWTGHPMLYGVSPTLLPRPRDWPDNAQMCGQWELPAPAWTPPPALEAFLAAGEPPVYIGFGSMAGFDRARLAQAMIAAAAGRRVLFHPGWSGVDADMLPDNFFIVGDTPHHWLFPRTAMAVHHGGSGTSHSASRAGVPSVVVPFAGDQPFWADRLHRLGTADKPVNGRRLDVCTLGRAIAFADRADTRARATELGQRMAAEDGAGNAVAAIEQLLSI